jgi:hypothetical protein
MPHYPENCFDRNTLTSTSSVLKKRGATANCCSIIRFFCLNIRFSCLNIRFSCLNIRFSCSNIRFSCLNIRFFFIKYVGLVWLGMEI